MKTITELISTIFVLFILGALVYGGIKDGHAAKTFLIVGIVFVILYLLSVREDNIAKTHQAKIEKENRKKFDENLESFKYKMYQFAFKNERISKITYDIEEGGQYLSEFDKNVCQRIDDIIKRHVIYPKDNFEYMSSKIENEILELQKQPKENFIGF
jgi:hypothetical protein